MNLPTFGVRCLDARQVDDPAMNRTELQSAGEFAPQPKTTKPSTFSDRLVHEFLGVGALAVVHIATAISFARVFSGWDFLPSLIVMIVASHIVSALIRHWRVPFLFALPLLILIVYALVGYLSLRPTLRSGLPLSSTWSSLTKQINNSWQLLGDVVPPLSHDSGFGLVALCAVGICAVLADSFAFRFGGRVEAFVPATVVFVVVSAVGIDRHRVTVAAVWIAALLAAVAILRARDRSLDLLTRPNSFGYRPAFTLLRLSATGIFLATAIGIASWLIGPSLPGAGQEAWLTTRQTGQARVLEPLVDVRRRLSNPTDQVLFTVTAERSAYWRLTSLPVFDGSTWTLPGSLLNDAGGELASLPDASRPGFDIASNVQRISISNLAGTLLPVSYTPVQLRASSRSLFYELQTGSLVVGGDGMMANDRYELVSSLVTPRPELLGTASVQSPPVLDSLDTSYLAVPDNEETRQLKRLATEIVDPAASPYVIALGLQSYFRDNFTYSLDVPTELDGAATLAFLERRTGYCEQFSSTFALFARILGIPSRVAVGFTPGEVVNQVDERSVFEVRPQHAHAWPELWFDDIGWVLFEPTPGRGAPNAGYTNVPEEQDDSIPIPSQAIAPTTTTVAPVPDEDPSVDSPTSTDESNDTEVASKDSDTFLETWRWPLAILGILALWVFLLPLVVQRFMNRYRTGTLLDSWRKVVALYEFQRGPFDPSLSPQEIAAVATSRLWDDDPFITELAQVVTEVLYSSRSLDVAEYEALTTRTQMYLTERISRLPLGSRLRLRLSPWVIARVTGARQQWKST